MITALPVQRAPRPGPRAVERLRHREGFNPLRSAGLAAAISLHLVLTGLMLAPITAPETATAPEIIRIEIHPDARKPPPIPPPPIERPQSRPAPPAPNPEVTSTVVAPAPDAAAGPVVDDASPLDVSADTADLAPDRGPPNAGSAPVSLRVLQSSAPRYPRAALMRRLEGEVELLILVGIDGRPESVSVSRSSGHAALDRAAREHVLRRWVFEPVERMGVPVPAYARVPVRFTLPE